MDHFGREFVCSEFDLTEGSHHLSELTNRTGPPQMQGISDGPLYFFRDACIAWSVNENLFFSWFVNLYFSVLGKLVFHLFVIREICINLLVFCEPTTFSGVNFYFFGDFCVIKARKTAKRKPAYSTRSRMEDWELTTARVNQEALESSLSRCVAHVFSMRQDSQ